jgi:hypothetical protein
MTRPSSEHVHYYFFQTRYSTQKFSKTVNVRDLEVNGRPTLYDLKGVGGASYVVAAGSVRENGQTYTVKDDFQVQDIPDWLVDWLCEDIRTYRAGLVAAKREKFAKQAALQARYTREKRAALRMEGHPDGFLIAKEDIRDYLVSLSFTLADAGLCTTLIKETLIAQAKEICDGGNAYVADEHNRISIARIADSASRTIIVDVAAKFYSPKKTKAHHSGLVMEVPCTQQDAMVEIMSYFPVEIDGTEACDKLREGVIGLNKLRAVAFRNACARAREEAGFESKSLGNGRALWRRTKGVEHGDIDA